MCKVFQCKGVSWFIQHVTSKLASVPPHSFSIFAPVILRCSNIRIRDRQNHLAVRLIKTDKVDDGDVIYGHLTEVS